MTSTVGRLSPSAPPDDEATGSGAVTERALTQRGLNTRNRLVAAGHHVFNSKPYHETRIVEITERAGVSTGSLYTYFESKEALFRVVAEDTLERMFSAPRRDPDNAAGNPVRNIAYASRQYFQVCREHRMIAQSIEQLRASDADIRRHRRDTLLRSAKRTERWVRRFQDKGICDRDIDPWYTALALQAMVVNLAYDQLVHRDDFDDVEALVAAVTPIWARAVGLDDWL